MPVAMSLLVAGVIWRFMFEPNGGLINILITSLGFPKIQWAGSVQSAMVTVLVPAIWKNVGYFMIILLASIKMCPVTTLKRPWSMAPHRFRYFAGSSCRC